VIHSALARDDGWWSFLSTEAVVIASRCHGAAHQLLGTPKWMVKIMEQPYSNG